VSAQPDEKLRIDKWLWHARFFKSRTLAAKSVTGGRVRVNRQVVKKANHAIQPGDVLTFPLGPHVRVIEVNALGVRRGPASEARTLYTDLDPPQPRAKPDLPPPPADGDPGSGRPTKKERRAVDWLKSWLGLD